MKYFGVLVSCPDATPLTYANSTAVCSASEYCSYFLLVPDAADEAAVTVSENAGVTK